MKKNKTLIAVIAVIAAAVVLIITIMAVALISMKKKPNPDPSSSIPSTEQIDYSDIDFGTLEAKAKTSFEELGERDNVSFTDKNLETQENPFGENNVSYISASSVGILTRQDAIDGISGRFQNLDMRWWQNTIISPEYSFQFDVKLYNTELSELRVVMETQGNGSATDYDLADPIFRITKNTEDGKPWIYDCNNNKVTSLEWEQAYTVAVNIKNVLFDSNGKTYQILVNEEEVGTPAFAGDYETGVKLLRNIKLTVADQSDIMLDNITLSYCDTHSYPQKYSTQEKGNYYPSADYFPAQYVDTGEIRVYHNTVRQDYAAGEVTIEGGEAYLAASKILPELAGEGSSFDGSSLKVNGKTVDVSSFIVDKNGMAMISLDSLNKLFGAKVWLEAADKMIIITTGSMVNDNFLYACGYKFVMNGEPYYSVGFNKYDISYNIVNYYMAQDDPNFNLDIAWNPNALQEEEEALKVLHEHGVTAIRCFLNAAYWPNIFTDSRAKNAYYRGMDYFYDLCDKYEIKVVGSLMLMDATFYASVPVNEGTYGYVSLGDNAWDILSNPNCASRRNVEVYLREYIGRYKDRSTVLMWEIGNEINLRADIGNSHWGIQPSALQVGQFYEDITNIIHSIDPHHMVTNGDAVIKPEQYHLLQGVLRGQPDQWVKDNAEQQYQMRWIFNRAVDVISDHYDTDFERLELYSKSFDKPMFLGEVGAADEGAGLNGGIHNTDGSPNREFLQNAKKYLDKFLNTDFQICLWWNFNGMDPSPDGWSKWNITSEDTEMMQLITDAQRDAQNKVVNGVANTNTVTADNSIVGQLLKG